MLKGSERSAAYPWRTLLDAFYDAAQAGSSRGVYLWAHDGSREFRTWAQLHERTKRLAAALEQESVGVGDRVLLLMPTSYEFIISFFGIMSVGAIPVPASMRMQKDTHRNLEVWHKFARRLNVATVLYHDALPMEHRPEAGPASVYERAFSFDQLMQMVAADAAPKMLATSSQEAYIQATSGAQGRMRAVVLTHTNILSSIVSVGDAIVVGPEEIGVSWLPLDNIMGLLGFVCLPICFGMDTVLLSPERFLSKPHEWLWAIDQHKASITAAPDFAYHYALRRARARELEDLDLSSWRVAMSGGEQVRAEHMSEFIERFAPYGLSDDVFLPVYGLAEGTLGVTFGSVSTRWHVDCVLRHELEFKGRAEPVSDVSQKEMRPHECLEVVSVGQPPAGIDVKILSKDGGEAPNRTLGLVAFRGPNTMERYALDLQEERDQVGAVVPQSGWMKTQDVGYIADGMLYILGRLDACIRTRWGRTVFPHEVEWLLNDIDGIRSGSTVAFLVGADEDERVVVAYEAQIGSELEEIETLVKETLATCMGLDPGVIVALTPFSIPKTRDGKVRRRLSRILYEASKLDRSERGHEWAGFTRLMTRAREDLRRISRSWRDRALGVLKNR